MYDPLDLPQSGAPLAESPASHAEDLPADWRLHRRWDRLGRLVGDRGVASLHDSHVLVIGLGGVGGFAVESLARSGVGRLTLVDFDKVCVTNTNRQLQAVRGAVGQLKATSLAERARSINPSAKVRAVPLFYEARLSEAMLGGGELGAPDYVVDAIDNVTAKCHLIAACRSKGLSIVCATGAAGRLDPTAVAVADLADTYNDPLAASVRKILRQRYEFPLQGRFGVAAVFSSERPSPPEVLAYDADHGFDCVCPNGENDHHTCDDRNVVWGSASFVTGTVGLVAASVVVRALVGR